MNWPLIVLGLVVAGVGIFVMIRYPDLIRGHIRIPWPFGEPLEVPVNAGLVLSLVGIGLIVAGVIWKPIPNPKPNQLDTMHLAGAAREPNGSDIVRLTGSQGNEAGAVWTTSPQDVTGLFTAEFEFEIEPTDEKGSDGIAFVIQNGDDEAVGAPGGGLGYHGLGGSVAVEFDAWQNRAGDRITSREQMTRNDPSRSHITVHTRGTGPNSADPAIGLSAQNVPRLDDSKEHHATIRYDGTTLRVWLDGRKYVEHRIHLSSTIGSASALVGLTAGSGSPDVAATHTVSRFFFEN